VIKFVGWKCAQLCGWTAGPRYTGSRCPACAADVVEDLRNVIPPEPAWSREPPWVAAFEHDLTELCRKHGVQLDHEDGHGSGLIGRVSKELAGCSFPFLTTCTCTWRWDVKANDHVCTEPDPECMRHGGAR
jgi:hypothetical protein